MKINLPIKCKECNYVGDYTTGVYSRNPHYCCELIWTLVHDDYKVNPEMLDDKCPLKNPSLLKAIEDTANSIGVEVESLVTE